MAVVVAMTLPATDWRVTIPYREPDYAMRNPDSPSEFLAVYKIRAQTAEAARQLALDIFQAEARSSSVGWRRVAIDDRITVVPV